MEFGRYLVLSTTHVRCATAQLLDVWASLSAMEQPLAVASTHYGWFLSTCELVESRALQLPEELPAILAFGRARGCAHILLDSDGPEIPDLPLFPW